MTPVITHVLPVYPQYVHIQWTVDDREGHLASVDILRATTPDGTFKEIASGLTSRIFTYHDNEAALHGFTTRYWYAIRATSSINPAQKVISEAKTVEYALEGHRAKIARKARRDLKVQLEKLNGVPLLIIKNKRFGPRCPECYSAATGESVFSNCNTCFGTTYEGGYHEPIRVFGKLDPVVIQPTLGTSGISESAVTGLTIVDYPEVDNEDVVVEIHTNRRFKVLRRMVTESSRVLVHQDLQVSELSRSAVEYNIPLEFN